LFKVLGQEKKVNIDVSIPPLGTKRFSAWKIFLVIALLSGIGFSIWYYFINKKDSKKEKLTETKKKNIKETIKVFKSKIKSFRSELREILPEKYKKYLPKSKEELEEESKIMKREIQKTHLKDMVLVMKKLNKGDKEISEKLAHEGLSNEEIKEVIRIVNMEEKLKSDIKQEEEAMKMVKLLDGNPDIKELLLKKGFSKEIIGKVFEEIEKDIEEKEKSLKNTNKEDK
jgi:hypothetical protein